MPSLAEQVREALLKTERSAVDVADAAGVHPVNLSQFKAGTRKMRLDALERIADALGLEIRLVPRLAKRSKPV